MRRGFLYFMEVNMIIGVTIFIALIVGVGLGFGIAFLLGVSRTKTAKQLADELFQESEDKRKETINAVIDNLKESFGNLSLSALSKSTDEFLKLAKEKLGSEREVSGKELESKKVLIDQQLQEMTNRLEEVKNLTKDLEKDRIAKFGELTKQLELTNKQTLDLTQTTNTLREALASSKVRGQWGERMAEDVLRIAGFIENVNYFKQKTIEGVGSRPDFTFPLPKDLKMNMDVKFPLENYIRYLEAKSDLEKTKYRSDFLRDVKVKIKDVTSREYINPSQNTVDYVLLFIPNEQIYGFIHEQDRNILDEAIKSKVIFCSPITFFAVLAVIRQAVDNFSLEKTSNQILSLLGGFKKQWNEFIKKFDILGKRLEDAQKEYDTLMTRRKRQLERPLSKIEELRTQRGLAIVSDEDQVLDYSDTDKEKETEVI